MTKRRPTDADYTGMAASYEAEPPTMDEVISIEINPAVLRKGRPTKGTPAADTPSCCVWSDGESLCGCAAAGAGRRHRSASHSSRLRVAALPGLRCAVRDRCSP
jgi:hypothetical protein